MSYSGRTGGADDGGRSGVSDAKGSRMRSPNERRRPYTYGIATVVILLLIWDAVIVWLVFTGRTVTEIGGDPAEDGLSRALREAYALASGLGLVALAASILVFRHRMLTFILLALLAIASLLILMLLGH